MTKPSFVYVTYIATTPEKMWQALVDTDVMRRYWADPTVDKPAHENTLFPYTTLFRSDRKSVV